jgi:hypothetical protein
VGELEPPVTADTSESAGVSENIEDSASACSGLGPIAEASTM